MLKGAGLLKGLGITFKKFFQKKITKQYPEERPQLPENSNEYFEFIPEKCTACTMCAVACPNKVILIDYSKGENNKRQLDKYSMALQYCMHCGLCVEACKFDALHHDTTFERTASNRKETFVSWDGVKPVVRDPGSDKEEN